jgi:hypothetical protein
MSIFSEIISTLMRTQRMFNCYMRVGETTVTFKGSVHLSLIEVGNSVMWDYAVAIHGQLKTRQFSITVALTQKLSFTKLFLATSLLIDLRFKKNKIYFRKGSQEAQKYLRSDPLNLLSG